MVTRALQVLPHNAKPHERLMPTLSPEKLQSVLEENGLHLRTIDEIMARIVKMTSSVSLSDIKTDLPKEQTEESDYNLEDLVNENVLKL